MLPTFVETNQQGLETYGLNQAFGSAVEVHLLVVQFNIDENS
jgi:hypothetical protein